MTDEEKRHDAIDRLGGESRLAKLQQRVEQLEDLLQGQQLRPGARLRNLHGSPGLMWWDGYAPTSAPVAYEGVLLALGDDWCVVRAGDEIYCVVMADITSHLKDCL